MRLAINAINTAPGGGLTVLLGLLQGWRELSAPLETTIFVGRTCVLDAVRRSGWADHVIPVLLDESPGRQFVYQRLRLGRDLPAHSSDLLLTTNHWIPRAACPQVVHFQNLLLLQHRSVWRCARAHSARIALQGVFARQALRCADANVFISDYMRCKGEELEPSSRERNYVALNGLDPEFIKLAGEAESPRERSHLIAVQQPARHKANDFLLRAFARLRRMLPAEDLNLDIVGGGDWSRWKAYAKDLGEEDHVHFVGAAPLNEVRELLLTSRCLLFSSHLEGFGLPIIEAMACACPVVAVDITAIPEICGGASLLSPPGDAEAFARAVAGVLTDSSLRERLVTTGRRRAMDFCWHSTGRRFLEVFDIVVRRRLRNGE